MRSDEYAKFLEKYRVLRIGSLSPDFAIEWKPKLEHFHLDDLLEAVTDVAADPRAKFPLNDLPLLIEHARCRQEERERRNRPRNQWNYGQKQPMPPLWDHVLLRHGIIDKAELKRRQTKRESQNATS